MPKMPFYSCTTQFNVPHVLMCHSDCKVSMIEALLFRNLSKNIQECKAKKKNTEISALRKLVIKHIVSLRAIDPETLLLIFLFL